MASRFPLQSWALAAGGAALLLFAALPAQAGGHGGGGYAGGAHLGGHAGGAHVGGHGYAHFASAGYGYGGYGYRGYRSRYGSYGYPYGGFYGVGLIGGGYPSYADTPSTTVVNNYYVQPLGQPQAHPVFVVPPGAAPAMMPPPAPAEAPLANAARVDINLPETAELFIQGVKMKQTGDRRSFVSPPLEPGQNYTYEFRAAWKDNGRDVAATHRLAVRAGEHQSVTFLTGSPEVAKADR